MKIALIRCSFASSDFAEVIPTFFGCSLRVERDTKDMAADVDLRLDVSKCDIEAVMFQIATKPLSLDLITISSVLNPLSH